MFKQKWVLVAFMMTAIGYVDETHAAPDAIMVAGGGTGAPLMAKAGEQFIKKFPQYKPVIAFDNPATVGFRNFCAGNGVDTPSLTTSTRAITADELALCNKNGVKDILEFSIGKNAMTIAKAPEGRLNELTLREVFLAVAKEVPDPKDQTKLIPNPYKSWKDINSELPDVKIQIKAPSPLFGLYQTYHKIIITGCKQAGFFKNLEVVNPKDFETACISFRRDGYTEYEKITDALQEIKTNPEMLGFLPFSAVLKDGFKPLIIDNIQATIATVSEGTYTFAFSLMVYLKKSHISLVPGLKEYLVELTSEEATGLTGYFRALGVVSLPPADRKKYRTEIEALKPVK